MLTVCQIARGASPPGGSGIEQPPPSAGSVIQEIPELPALPKAAPELHIEQKGAAPASSADQTKISVSSLRVTGARAFQEAELIAATGFKTGSQLTLTELRGLAARIADYYHNRGYFLVQAYLPAQEVKEGVVTIAVLEGLYGQISIKNNSRLSSELANDLLDGLASGQAVKVDPLEERLLLLSDLPGVNVKSTLVPGASVGNSDLIVELEPGRVISGSVDADNEGNRYTGTNRADLTVNLNDPTGHGDVASLRAVTSGSGLKYGRASYQMQFDRTKLGLASTDMRYELGDEFARLLAHATAQIWSVYVGYPLMRSRASNLSLLIDWDDKDFQDSDAAVGTTTDKKIRVALITLNGDERDGFIAGGLSNYSLSLASGDAELETAAALATDSATARAEGRYEKLSISASRLQVLGETTSVYAAISGQLASKNLDISEKMELGGANAVRSYPEGEAYCDKAYVLTGEYRWQLLRLQGSMGRNVQLIGFADTAKGDLEKSPWTNELNHRTLSDAGVGFNWADNANFVVKLYYAHRLGDAVALSAPDSSSRIWVQGVKYF